MNPLAKDNYEMFMDRLKEIEAIKGASDEERHFLQVAVIIENAGEIDYKKCKEMVIRNIFERLTMERRMKKFIKKDIK